MSVAFSILICNPQFSGGTRVLSCEMRRLENDCVLNILTSHIQMETLAPKEGWYASSVIGEFNSKYCSLQNETTGIDFALAKSLHSFAIVFPAPSDIRNSNSNILFLEIDAISKNITDQNLS